MEEKKSFVELWKYVFSFHTNFYGGTYFENLQAENVFSCCQ